VTGDRPSGVDAANVPCRRGLRNRSA